MAIDWKFFSWQLEGMQEGKASHTGILQVFVQVMYADISLVKASHMAKSHKEMYGSIFLQQKGEEWIFP